MLEQSELKELKDQIQSKSYYQAACTIIRKIQSITNKEEVVEQGSPYNDDTLKTVMEKAIELFFEDGDLQIPVAYVTGP